ncbi:MAG: hypothetical protein R3281_18805, partial [Balneolaceae bacterium]|nr:hypothetical protein [Balneolaceae bacterium]
VGAPFVLEGGDSGEEADATYDNYGNSLTLSSIIVHNNGDYQDKSNAGGDANTPDAQRYADAYETNDPMFANPQSYNYTLQSGSPALQSAETPPNDGFFDAVSYIGAFGADNWASDWARIGD